MVDVTEVMVNLLVNLALEELRKQGVSNSVAEGLTKGLKTSLLEKVKDKLLNAGLISATGAVINNIPSIPKYGGKMIGSIGRGLGHGGFERGYITGYETAIVTLKEFTTNLPLIGMISHINQLIELNPSTRLAKKVVIVAGTVGMGTAVVVYGTQKISAHLGERLAYQIAQELVSTEFKKLVSNKILNTKQQINLLRIIGETSSLNEILKLAKSLEDSSFLSQL